jgi:peptide/nickel transport system substrate-binding protein
MIRRTGIFLATLLSLILASLGGAEPSGSKVVTAPLIPTPGQPGGQLVVASNTPITTLNPFAITDPGATALFTLFLSSLVELNPLTSQLEPALAQRFTTSPDGLRVTFHLRDIQFSDGVPFTADDVIFTFKEVFLNPAVRTEVLQFLRSFFQADGQSLIQDVQKIDEKTVVFVLRRPSGLFWDLILQIPILPKHKLSQIPPQELSHAWSIHTSPNDLVGLGPFRIKEIQKTGIPFITERVAAIIFERNPLYWKVDEAGTQLPYLDQITWRVIPSSDEALTAFAQNEIDLFLPDPMQIRSLPASTQLVKDGPTDLLYFLALNQDINNEEKRQLFQDLRFRQALAYLTDRNTLVQQFPEGLAVPRWSFIHPLSPYFDEEALIIYAFDPQKAASLLDELGLKDTNGDGWREMPDGSTLQLEFMVRDDDPLRIAMAEIYQQRLERVGIKVVLEEVDLGEWRRRLSNPPHYELVISKIPLKIYRPQFVIPRLKSLFHSEGELHFYRYSDAQGQLNEVQQQINEILEELERGARDQQTLFSELQRLLSQDLPLIPLSSPQYIVALQPGIKNGLSMNVLGFDRFLEVLWQGE